MLELTIAQQRQFLHRVLKAQEDERRRIARELHDTLAQDLAAYRLELERLAKRADAPAIRPRIETLEERAESMLQTVRQILLDLRLSVLESCSGTSSASSATTTFARRCYSTARTPFRSTTTPR